MADDCFLWFLRRECATVFGVGKKRHVAVFVLLFVVENDIFCRGDKLAKVFPDCFQSFTDFVCSAFPRPICGLTLCGFSLHFLTSCGWYQCPSVWYFVTPL